MISSKSGSHRNLAFGLEHPKWSIYIVPTSCQSLLFSSESPRSWQPTIQNSFHQVVQDERDTEPETLHSGCWCCYSSWSWVGSHHHKAKKTTVPSHPNLLANSINEELVWSLDAEVPESSSRWIRSRARVWLEKSFQVVLGGLLPRWSNPSYLYMRWLGPQLRHPLHDSRWWRKRFEKSTLYGAELANSCVNPWARGDQHVRVP